MQEKDVGPAVWHGDSVSAASYQHPSLTPTSLSGTSSLTPVWQPLAPWFFGLCA